MAEYAVEKLESAFHDLQSMLPAQWAHTGDSDIECQPNWAMYQQLEQREALLLVIARDEGMPVGYMAAFLYPHPNAVSVKVAEIKTYYVDEGRPMVLNSMVKFTVDELVRRGAYKIKASTNADDSAARLWELHGFEVSEIGLTLKLQSRGAKDA
jgi:hypothetical protein